MNYGKAESSTFSTIKKSVLSKFQIKSALGATLLLSAGFAASLPAAAQMFVTSAPNNVISFQPTVTVVGNNVDAAAAFSNDRTQTFTLGGQVFVNLLNSGPITGAGLAIINTQAGQPIAITNDGSVIESATASGGLRITSTGGNVSYEGTGNVSSTAGGLFSDALRISPAGGNVDIGSGTPISGAITATGIGYGIWVSGASGNVNISTDNLTISGFRGISVVGATGSVSVTASDQTVINAVPGGSDGIILSGDAVTILSGANIGSAGTPFTNGIQAFGVNGQTSVNVNGGSIFATGFGINAQSSGTGFLGVQLLAPAKISMTGGTGINAIQQAGATGGITIFQNGIIDPPNVGINAQILNAANGADILVNSVGALSANITGINATTVGAGNVTVNAAGGVTAGTGRGINVATTSGTGTVGINSTINSGAGGVRVTTTSGPIFITGAGNVTSGSSENAVTAISNTGIATINVNGTLSGFRNGIGVNAGGANITTGDGAIIGRRRIGIGVTLTAAAPGNVVITTGAGSVQGQGAGGVLGTGIGVDASAAAGRTVTIVTGTGSVSGLLTSGIRAQTTNGLISVTTTGVTSGLTNGIFLSSNGGPIVVQANGGVAGTNFNGIRAESLGGQINITANSTVLGIGNNGIFADGRNAGAGANNVMVFTGAGQIAGFQHGIAAFADVGILTVSTGAGAVTGGTFGGAGHGILARSLIAVNINVGTGGAVALNGAFDGVNAGSTTAFITITTAGLVQSNNRHGIVATAPGAITITTNGPVNANGFGILANGGNGAVTVTSNGPITSNNDGMNLRSTIGNITANVNGAITSALTDGVDARSTGGANVIINVNSKIVAANVGALAATNGAGNATINVNAGANIDPLIGAQAITVNGAALINVANGGTVDGDLIGAQALSTNGTATVNNTIAGGGRILSLAGGTAAQANSTNNVAQVRNGATGLILSNGGIGAHAISTNGALASIINAGVIATFNNTAALINDTNVDGTVTNSSSILAAAGGTGVGIFVGRDATVNNNAGVIEGGSGIVGNAGRDWFVNNAATIASNGGVQLAANLFATRDIFYVNNGQIVGNSVLTAGDDIFITNNGQMLSFNNLDTGPVLNTNSTDNTVLNNNNLLTGRVNMVAGDTIVFSNNAGGTWNVQGVNTIIATNGATVTNNGLINIAGTSTFAFGAGPDVLTNNATINVIANNANATFTALENFNNNNRINMQNGVSAIAANGLTDAPYGTGIGNFVSTTGNFNGGAASIMWIDSFVGAPGAASSSDGLIVTMGATAGVTGLFINDLNAGAGVFNPIGIPVVQVSSGVTALGHFVIAPGSSNFQLRNGVGVMDKGLFVTSIQLGASADNAFPAGVAHILVSTPDREIYELSKIGTAAQNIWHESAGVWRDRVTDLRNYLSVSIGSANGSGADLPVDQGEPVAPVVQTNRVTPGIWMKTLGSITDRKNTDTYVLPAPAIGTFSYNTSYDQKTFGVIAGLDYGRTRAHDALLVGVFGGYLKSKLDFDVGFNGITYDGGTFGAYLSYINRNFYFDLLAKADLLDVTYRAGTLGPSGFSTDAKTYGVRADMGYRYALGGSNRAFIEPLATFTWLTSDIDNMTILGTPITFKDGNSLRGALGLRLSGSSIRGVTRYNANVTGRIWHEFDNKANGLTFVSGGLTQSINDSFNGTFAEVSAGVTAQNLRNGWSGFARASYKFSNDIKTFTGRVGFRKQW